MAQLSQNLKLFNLFTPSLPALVALSDAHPTDDQEVAGLIPAGSSDILSWRLIMKYFLQHSPPSAGSRTASVSFWQKNVHKYWLTA